MKNSLANMGEETCRHVVLWIAASIVGKIFFLFLFESVSNDEFRHLWCYFASII